MSEHTTKELIACVIEERLKNCPPEKWTGQEPKFATIALELTYLNHLTEQGWWDDYSHDSDAETILCYFGSIVAEAAAVCAGRETFEKQNRKMSGSSYGMVCIICFYLEWLASVEKNKAVQEKIERTKDALELVAIHFRDRTKAEFYASHPSVAKYDRQQ